MNETTALALEARANDLDKTATALRGLAAQVRIGEVKAAAPGLLSIKEAVSYSGLSEWAVRELLADGQLDEVRIGRRRLVSRSSLDGLADLQAAS